MFLHTPGIQIWTEHDSHLECYKELVEMVHLNEDAVAVCKEGARD